MVVVRVTCCIFGIFRLARPQRTISAHDLGARSRRGLWGLEQYIYYMGLGGGYGGMHSSAALVATVRV